MTTIKTAMLTLAALAMTLAAAPAAAVDFHGYARSGMMGNSGGGGLACFGSGTPLTADGYKFRLGNECETYAEAEFAQTLYKDKSGVEFTYDTMLAYVTQGMQSFESLKSGSGDIALRQLWVGAKNVPFLPSATFWIGNRYYKRHDVHMAAWMSTARIMAITIAAGAPWPETSATTTAKRSASSRMTS